MGTVVTSNPQLANNAPAAWNKLSSKPRSPMLAEVQGMNCTKLYKFDDELYEEMTAFNIQSLYDKFKKKKVTIDILWDLDNELLENIGLSPVEKLKYTKAKQNWEKEKQDNFLPYSQRQDKKIHSEDNDISYGGNALCSLIIKEDQELSDELTDFKIQSLYEKLYEKGVTIDILWELNDELLKEIGLTQLESLKYTKAKEKWELKETGKLNDTLLNTGRQNRESLDLSHASNCSETNDKGKYLFLF